MKDMKIDFSHIEVYTDLEKKNKVIADERKNFANIMYQYGQGIAFHALALKIYNSQGEEEFNNEEYDLITKTADMFYAPCFIDALRNKKEAQDEKDNK